MFISSMEWLKKEEDILYNSQFFFYDAFFPEAARILDPLGRILASINDEKDGIIHASLDYDIAKQMKHDYYTMLTERRPDVYIA